MKHLHYTYDSIIDFYQEATTLTPEGNSGEFHNIISSDLPRFRGMCLEDIKKNKYGWKEGLEKVEELDAEFNLGGSTRSYIYDEFDGDDINYDRLLDGFPAMRKRVKKHGIGSGRLINIYVVISENCSVDANSMINKAFTAFKIVDLLENIGYRVAIYSCDYTEDPSGSYKGEKGVKYSLEVCLKRHEDSLNKALVLNGISPWFFRYYMFAHQTSYYHTGWGLGQACFADISQTKENIVINRGECLTPIGAETKIKQIIKLFEID